MVRNLASTLASRFDTDSATKSSRKMRSSVNRSLKALAIPVWYLIGGVALFACGSGAPLASHAESRHGTTNRTTTTISVANIDRTLDAKACSNLAQAMQQSASGRVGTNTAMALADAANAAGQGGKGSTAPAQLARDANAFQQMFLSSSAGAGNVNYYPTSAIVHDCAADGVKVPNMPNAPSTATTAPSTGAVIHLLEQFFSGGCGGGCAQVSEPASAFTVNLDPNDSSWARWTVSDPNLGTAYGYAQDLGGSWQVVSGPGSGQVGCTHVPLQILSDFGETCSAPSAPPTTTTEPAPTGNQLQQAYQAGLRDGSFMQFPSSFSSGSAQNAASTLCRLHSEGYSQNLEVQAQYLDGCMAGFQTS